MTCREYMLAEWARVPMLPTDDHWRRAWGNVVARAISAYSFGAVQDAIKADAKLTELAEACRHVNVDAYKPETYFKREDELLARIAELEAALKPFAAFASNVDLEGWTSTIHRERISTWFGPSDFRAAGKALQKSTPDK